MLTDHLLASSTQLLAIGHGTTCEGMFKCHWCGAPCGDSFQHDDKGLIPFSKDRSYARHPSESYICNGCWLFRRGRTTITYLGGGYSDGQLARNHSWLVTERSTHALREQSREALLQFLLEPTHRFALSILTEQVENLLHLCPVNAFREIRADTSLSFCLNNVRHEYSVYELRETMKRRQVKGKSPGVRVLLDYLGDAVRYDDDKEEKKGRGRPHGQQNLINEHREVIRKSSGRQLAATEK